MTARRGQSQFTEWYDGSDVVLQSTVVGDAHPTYKLTADGTVATGDGTTAPTQQSGGSGTGWTEHDLSLLAADGFHSGTGTWADAAGPIIQQTLNTGAGVLGWQVGLGSTEYIVQVDVRIPTGQGVATTVKVGFQAGESVTDTGSGVVPVDVGLGVGLLAHAAGDATAYDLQGIVDGSGNMSAGAGPAVTIAADTWVTLRAFISISAQVLYLDGVYKGCTQALSGGNAYDPANQQGPDSVSLAATGLVDFRNLKVWTRTLPA